jgi:hypothetical protein
VGAEVAAAVWFDARAGAAAGGSLLSQAAAKASARHASVARRARTPLPDRLPTTVEDDDLIR